MSLKLKGSDALKHVTVSLYPSQIRSMRESAAKFGSVGRAVLVAVEVLSDMAERGYLINSGAAFATQTSEELKAPLSFGVLPRTERMIRRLSMIYGDKNGVLRAVCYWLEKS